MKNHYAVLGVSATATPEEIKAAYRRMAMICHPDRGGKKEEFQLVQDAYAVLSDSTLREEYNATLKQRTYRDAINQQITVLVDEETALYGGEIEVSVGGRDIRFKINAGTLPNQIYTLPNFAHNLYGGDYADLLLKIKIREKSKDVFLEVDMLTMVFGGVVSVEVMGKTIEFTVPKMTAPNSILKVNADGVVINMTITPVLPTSDSKKLQIISALLEE